MSDVKVPAHLTDFVDVLGEELAIDFLLCFGGAGLYLPSKFPRDGHMLVDLVGREKSIELGTKMGSGYIKVPTAKPYIIQFLFAKGATISDICRKLHMTEPAVRRHLAPEVRQARQLSLFSNT